VKDTNINNGEVNDAADLTACQEVCINLPNCTGVDWNPSSSVGTRCWLSGPWSGTRNAGIAVGITHYDLTRTCRGISSCIFYSCFAKLRKVLSNSHLT